MRPWRLGGRPSSQLQPDLPTLLGSSLMRSVGRSVGLVWITLFPGRSFSVVKSMSVLGLPTKRRRASAALGVVKDEVQEQRGEQHVTPAQQPHECHLCVHNPNLDAYISGAVDILAPHMYVPDISRAIWRNFLSHHSTRLAGE